MCEFYFIFLIGASSFRIKRKLFLTGAGVATIKNFQPFSMLGSPRSLAVLELLDANELPFGKSPVLTTVQFLNCFSVGGLAPNKFFALSGFGDDNETRGFVCVFGFYSVGVYRCHACILAQISTN